VPSSVACRSRSFSCSRPLRRSRSQCSSRSRVSSWGASCGLTPLQEIDTVVERTGVGTQPLPSNQLAGSVRVRDQLSRDDEVLRSAGRVLRGPRGRSTRPGRLRGGAGTVEHTEASDSDREHRGRLRLIRPRRLQRHGRGRVRGLILAQGDIMGPQLFSIVRLGDVNNAGSISLMTSDYNSTDRQIWRVDGAFDEPPPPPPGPRPGDRLRALLRWLLTIIFGRWPVSSTSPCAPTSSPAVHARPASASHAATATHERLCSPQTVIPSSFALAVTL
jgi:hypothetical protein